MTLQRAELPGGKIPDGMVKVHWVLKTGGAIETIEIDDVDRIKASQFVVPGDCVYDITSVARRDETLIAFCWPATV